MFKKILFQLLLLCSLLPLQSMGQAKSRYNFFSYNVNEGLLQSNVLDMAFDQNNFCWLSFTNGIQKFDGNKFTDIPTQPGLPDDKGCQFFRQQNGSLLVFHSGGISKYNINKDQFELVYRKSAGVHSKLLILGESKKQLYLFDSSANIIVLDESNYRQIRIASSGLPSYGPQPDNFPSVSNVINGKVHIYINGYLYHWDLVTGKLLNQSEKLPPISPYFIGHYSEDEPLFFSLGKVASLVKYDYITKKLIPLFKEEIQYTRSFRGVVRKWSNKTIMSYYNRLYEMDAGMNTVMAAITDFRNNPFPGNSSVNKIVTDNFDNVFLVTINDGIKKLRKNNYPIRYFGTSSKENNYVISVYADKSRNNILAGTYGGGLMIFDTLQHLKKHIEYLPGGGDEKFSVNSITQNAAGDYIFLVPSRQEAYLLSKDLGTIKPIPVKTPDGRPATVYGYFGSLVNENLTLAILQSEKEIYLVDKHNNQITQHNISRTFTHSSLFFQRSLVVHSNDQLTFLDTNYFKPTKSIAFPNTGGVRCYLTDGKNIYLGSNKGIFMISAEGKILKQFNKTTGLPDECIYAMQFDAGNNIWCSTNKGIFKISANGSFLQLTKQDGLQENEFNTNAIYKTGDGEVFFGGVNGLNSFLPAAIPDFMVDVTIYLNQVKVNNIPLKRDIATWNLEKIILPYDENALSLEFIASGPLNIDQYTHQYKMEGVDKEWIKNDGMQPARYVLPPGSYTFNMYAASYFDKEAVALKQLIIIIKPPFYKTGWFITLVSLLIILLVIYMVNSYNKIHYRKKMGILITQRKVQEEKERIAMELHDSIGAYANAVLYNTELLETEKVEQEKKRLMKDLRFVSKDIITALRETIWALKADNYSAQECLMRIRNFVHPFSRYYPAITFKIQGDAPPEKHLPYGTALNIVRIVQESVNNAIKHSNPTLISLTSATVGDQWRLIISDDGTGFNVNDLSDGNGLKNMNKRAAELGFYISITSAENSGTVITIKV